MPKRHEPRFWHRVTKAVFPKMKLHDQENPESYIGREILARPELDAPDEKIKIEHIKGSLRHAKQFEINGTHWVHMYSFFTQMLENRTPTPEEMDEFETASQITRISETKNGKS